jgi:hypothetical protein
MAQWSEIKTDLPNRRLWFRRCSSAGCRPPRFLIVLLTPAGRDRQPFPISPMDQPGNEHDLSYVICRVRQRALDRQLYRMWFAANRHRIAEIVGR